jgi:predicted transcriptional regulator
MPTSTTTLRLDPKLKARIAKFAKRDGKSPHSFVLETLDEALAQRELREDFERDADEGEEQIRTTGKALDWGETQEWILALAAGKPARRPRLKKISQLK